MEGKHPAGPDNTFDGIPRQPDNEPGGKNPSALLYLALGTGTAAYCLILLISRDALIENIALLGTGALALILASLWGLWVRN